MIESKVASAVRTLALYKSFRIAAEVMGTSSSSFSRYIRQAEDYAGQVLFERCGKAVAITPAGQEFLSLLDKLQEAVGQFETGTERLRLAGPDVVNIGCGPLVARTIISPLISDLMDTHPDIRARIMVRTSKEPLELLRTGSLDIVVCDLTHTPDLSDLEVHLLKKRRTSFWARPQHPIHSKAKVHVRDVFMSRLGTGSMPPYWKKQIRQLIDPNGTSSDLTARMPHIESDDFSMLAEIASRSNLICGGMAEDFLHYKRMGLLKEIQTVERMTWNICLARRNNASFSMLDLIWNKTLQEHGDAHESGLAAQ